MANGHIGDSKLADMLRQWAALAAPGLGAVVLRFKRAEAGACNWEVAGITCGSADRDTAARAVAEAAWALALHWIMVPDGDPRDEQDVGPVSPEELSRWPARTPRYP